MEAKKGAAYRVLPTPVHTNSLIRGLSQGRGESTADARLRYTIRHAFSHHSSLRSRGSNPDGCPMHTARRDHSHRRRSPIQKWPVRSPQAASGACCLRVDGSWVCWSGAGHGNAMQCCTLGRWMPCSSAYSHCCSAACAHTRHDGRLGRGGQRKKQAAKTGRDGRCGGSPCDRADTPCPIVTRGRDGDGGSAAVPVAWTWKSEPLHLPPPFWPCAIVCGVL